MPTRDAKRLDRARGSGERRVLACPADAEAAWDTWRTTPWVRNPVGTVTRDIVDRPSPEGAARWHVVGSRTAPNPAVLEAEKMRQSSVTSQVPGKILLDNR
ncbi:MAG: hypothetical protein M0Z53_12105 [Thermaerobacter sp.]|nr:hypothetical protein [Thermaerobacter sp.]